MQHRVIVSFGKNQQFDYKFAPGQVQESAVEEARKWFNREFDALGCEVESPTGKVLIIDRILSVAKFAGPQRFEQQADWADHFARYSATVLGRDLVRVDVAAYAIGY